MQPCKWYRAFLHFIIMKFLLCLCFFASHAFSQSGQNSTLSPYDSSILSWRQQRLTRLTSETGWLTLVGLFWLNEGENRCGSDPSNTVILSGEKTPAYVGTIGRKKDSLWFKASESATVYSNNLPVSNIPLLSDKNGAQEPTVLQIGSVRFYVIERGNELGVRVKDSESTSRKNFKGLEYFPIDPRWKVRAMFEPYEPPKRFRVPTSASIDDEYVSPGALVFRYNDSTYRIDAVIETGSEDALFVMFMDKTSGRETYGGGRQLYTALPDSNGMVWIDFNKAYNWPCIFTDFATCPIPPKQNHLPFRVEAGEKMYKGHE